MAAGATLCKGLNRGIGTVLAGLLAFLIEYIAKASGHVFQAISIGAAVFLIGILTTSESIINFTILIDELMLWCHFDFMTGAAATYIRFFPHIKKNYDYGIVIFLLTFNLITVTGYRVDSVFKIAHDRVLTIAIGCGICLLMSLLIFPNWSGEDLHDSTVFKLEGLAYSIEGMQTPYIQLSILLFLKEILL